MIVDLNGGDLVREKGEAYDMRTERGIADTTNPNMRAGRKNGHRSVGDREDAASMGSRPSTVWSRLKTACTTRLLPLLLFGLPAMAQAQFNCTTNSGTITITGYTGLGGDVTVPSTINGLAVTTIGNRAFSYCASLLNVRLPDSITNISDMAFYWCGNLTNVTMGSGLSSIGGSAFAYCRLTSITIPNSVASLGSCAFEYCDNLTAVNIPSTVTNIGASPFAGCSSLHAITVDTLNSFYTGVDGVLFNKSLTSIIQYPARKDGSQYAIPTSVESIMDSAFLECTSLTNVAIPNGVTSIGNTAFWLCMSLINVTLPSSVTSIRSGAFGGCYGLGAITVDPLNAMYRSVDGVLLNKTDTVLIQFPGGKAGAYTIPNTVTSITEFAFADCRQLTSITLSDSATSTGWAAFTGCTSLTNVTLPNGVTTIDSYAFDYCTSLGSVTLPNSITRLDDFAFRSCTSLLSLTIPSKVTTIEEYVFFGCTSLRSLYFRGDAPSVASDALDGATNATIYYLPGTSGWGPTFGGRPTMLWDLPVPYTYTTNNGTITITGYTGSGGAVTIPSTINGLPVTGIESGAFSLSPILTAVTIPNSVTRIGDWAFEQCTGLTSVTIGNGATNIGVRAFYYCTSLTNVTIGYSVKTIGFQAFDRCTSLSGISVDALNSVYSSVDGVVLSRDQRTLLICPGGKAGEYLIPNSVTRIEYEAFWFLDVFNG